jgi:threonine dehydratase
VKLEPPTRIPSPDELLAGLLEARARVADIAHRTPVVTSRTLDDLVGASVFLKCENLQKGGAFKVRGAFNRIARLSDEERRRGVIAYSSGNHAQAVSLVARRFGIPAVIVMPSWVARPKLEATRGYGAEVVLHEPSKEDREGIAVRLANERGLTLVPPFDHPDIVAGQGTAALELLEDIGTLDFLVVPVGGGGLISGSALAARHRSPGCRVFGVEPEGGDDGVRSFRAGRLVRIDEARTIADGARTPSLGTLTFELIRRSVDEMLAVPDEALVRAMRFAWERLKLVVEPTGTLGLAALLEGRIPCRECRVGVILSGGNVDLGQGLRWLRDGLVAGSAGSATSSRP